MPNTLIRDGTREYREAIAYVPYRAAYTYWETREGWRPVYPTPGAVWGYDPATGLVNAFPGPAPWLEPFTYNVPITVPEQVEVAGYEGGWVDVPPAGWTSTAFSVVSIPGSGNATFKVQPSVRGVAIGLTSTPVASGAGYGHIPHGIRFADGHAYSLRDGTDLGATAEADVWGMTVTGGQALLKKNGSTVATETSTLPNTALYLAAVMVSLGDEVDEPTLDSVFSGSAAMTMALSMYGVASAHAQALMTTPAFTMEAESHNAPEIRLAMFAAESTAGYATLLLPEITLAASSEPLPPQPATAYMPLPAFILTANSLTGEIGTAAMTAPPFSMVAYDYAYAGAVMTMPPFSLNAWEEPSDEAYAFEVIIANAPIEATTTLLVIIMDGGVVASTAVPSTLIDALAQTNGLAADSVAISQLLEALAFSFANAGNTVLVPGLGTETWVFNPASEGSTTYSNFDFNSYANIGGRYYGANENGVFELTGDTDDGALIRASVNFGKLNFGTTAKKTVEQVYIGMSAAGNIFVKLTAEGKSYVYKTRDFNEELQQQRVTPGKGLRTSYVTLELYNENGADFEIDSVEFIVADMTRKI